MSASTQPTIAITVNGEAQTVPEGHALPDLLRNLEIDLEDGTGVAVAVNESVVRRQEWATVSFSDGDTVEVIQAQQGG